MQIKSSTKGVVKSVKVKKSSGNKIFDNSAIEAVRRSSPLPFPKNAVWAKELTTFDYRFKPQ